MPARKAKSKDERVLDIRVVFRGKDAELAYFIEEQARLNDRRPQAQVRFFIRQVMEAHLNG